MRRKARNRAEAAEGDADADASAQAHEEFWSGAPVGVDEHLQTLAGVIETDAQEMADETLEYMGSVPGTRAEAEELIELAEWAEAKACRVCRKKMQDTHDPASLKHDECRTGLRVGRLLRRYD